MATLPIRPTAKESERELYAGIDLHSNNSVVVVLDEHDHILVHKRLPNALPVIVEVLASCPVPIQGIAVESTFNWYWLVDGLQAAGHSVHLVNTAALDLLPAQKRALQANLAVMACVEVHALEGEILQQAKLRPDYQRLMSVSGIGKVLALTIALETGDIARFASPGNFASYARLVNSKRESNGKTKGVGNTKCGNKYLSWAFIEAAHFAVRYDGAVKRFYQKKCAKGLSVVAIKAVAHKLARACFHVMRDKVAFDVQRAFG